MIFQYTLSQVLSGEKTQTRRIIRVGDEAIHGDDGRIEAILHNGRKKYVVGNTYAVQPGRTLPQVARIRLTAIDREHVASISTEDAIAEGYGNADEFIAGWVNIYGENSLDQEVWVVSFELVE